MLQEVLLQLEEQKLRLKELTRQVVDQNEALWNSVLGMQRQIAELVARSGGASHSSALATGLSSAQVVPSSRPLATTSAVNQGSLRPRRH
jgi:hypothetical protein